MFPKIEKDEKLPSNGDNKPNNESILKASILIMNIDRKIESKLSADDIQLYLQN